MPDFSKLRFLHNDPQFARLPYSKQTMLRQVVIKRALEKDEDTRQLLGKMSNVGRRKLTQQLADLPPIYQDEAFGTQANAFVDDIQKGDPQAIGVFVSNIMSRAGAKWGLLKGIGKFGMMKLADWMQDKDWRNAVAQYATTDFNIGADADKFYAYASQRMVKDDPKRSEQVLKALRFAETAAKPLAFAADIAAMWGGSSAIQGAVLATKMTPAGVKAVGIGAKAAEAVKATGAGGKVLSWLARVGITESFEALLGGAYGVARENMIGLATGDTDRITDTTKEIGRAFGYGAALDLAVGMTVSSIAPHVGGALRSIFGKNKHKLVRARASKVEWDDFLKQVQDGSLEPHQIGILEANSPDLADMYIQKQAINQAADKAFDLELYPVLKARLMGESNGFAVRELADGKVRITNIKSVMDGAKNTQEVFDSLPDALTKQANDIIGQAKRWPKGQWDEWVSNPLNKDLATIGMSLNKINSVLDPAYEWGLTKQLHKEMIDARPSSYKSPVRRVGLTKGEADELVVNKGAIRVDLGEPETLAKQMEETPRRFIQPGKTAIFKQADETTKATGLVVTNQPVDQDWIAEYADVTAKQIKQSNPDVKQSVDDLRRYILMKNGYDSIVKGDQVETFYPNRVRIEGSEAEEVLQAGERDYLKGAKAVFVDNRIKGLQRQGDNLVTNQAEAHKYFAQFDNPRKMKNLTKVMDNADFQVWKTEYNKYRLELPAAGVSREFPNMKELRKFARQSWSDPNVVFSEAKRRGMDVSIEAGRYKITPPNGDPMYASTNDEVKAIFKQYPDPEGAPEIFEEFDPGFTHRFEDIIMAQDQSMVPPATVRFDLSAPNQVNSISGKIELTPSQYFGKAHQQMDRWVEGVTRTSGATDLQDAFNTARRMEYVKRGYLDRIVDSVHNDVFTTPKGVKMWKKEYAPKRKMMTWYFAQKADDPMAKTEYQRLVKELGEFTDDEMVVVERYREMFDALGKRFGVPPEKMIQDYIPRVRRMMENGELNDFLTNGDVDGMVDHIFGASPTGKSMGNIKPWFLEDRSSDAIQFLVEDDAMFLMLKYADRGLNNQYLHEPFVRLREVTKNLDAGDRLDHVYRYMRKALNNWSTASDSMIKGMGESFAKKLNVKGFSPQDGRNMLETLYTLNYLTNMAWRPWLAIRNSFQVWTTLAGRAGNEVTAQAIRDVNKLVASGSPEIENLRHLGIIDRRPPIRGELGGFGTRLNRVARRAFKMFKGSDDYTRLIAWKTSQILLDRGLAKVDEGVIDLATRKGKLAFLDTTKLRSAEPRTAEDIYRLVKKATSGDVIDQDTIAAARSIYGQKLISESMFDYTSSQTGTAFDGVVGKAFGRYGTYSLGYRAAMWRGLRYGTFADKAGFIARFVGNQAALWGAFQLMGIDADNFIPGVPAVFGGGPLFDLGLTILKATGVKNYESRQARGELANALTQLVPGSLQHRYLKKAMEYAEEGDWYRALLSITTTPVVKSN